MKLMNELTQLNESNMTLKQHADIKRRLKADVERLQLIRDKAQDALGAAKEKLLKHEKLHPKYDAKQAAKAKKAGPYHEPGRDAEPTPSGGMGGRMLSTRWEGE